MLYSIRQFQQTRARDPPFWVKEVSSQVEEAHCKQPLINSQQKVGALSHTAPEKEFCQQGE